MLRLALFFLSVCLTACSGQFSVPDETVRLAPEGAYAADISPSAELAVVSSVSQGVLVWDLKQREQKYQWQHQGEGSNDVINVHIAADQTFVVTADREAFALWRVASGEPEGFWRIDESSIRGVAVSNNGRGILVGRGNGKVMFFEPFTGRRLEFLGHQEKINSLDLSPNGFFALTGGNDYVAYLWDTRSGQVIHRFTHASRVTKVALDDYGRYAFTADSKRGAKIWDVQTGALVSTLKYLQRQKIFSVASFSEDGQYLLTGSPSRRVNLWDVQSGSEVKEWLVAPRENQTPKSAVVYGVGFVGSNQTTTISSSGLNEFWSINKEG